jgi:glycosyltransferase involved in cell wall biosynthesis
MVGAERRPGAVPFLHRSGGAEDPALRQSMGAAGRALAEREFNIDRVARIHVEIYDALSA